MSDESSEKIENGESEQSKQPNEESDSPATTSGAITTSNPQKSSLKKRPMDGRRESQESSKSVSFVEEVDVRVIIVEPTVDFDLRKKPVLGRIEPQPTASLDALCQDITQVATEDLDSSTSKSGRPRRVRIKPPVPTFDEEFARMDIYMRRHYPLYYRFLKAHIITSEYGSEEYVVQESEFKEAIVACQQYPQEYFQDLENTLKTHGAMLEEEEKNSKKKK